MRPTEPEEAPGEHHRSGGFSTVAVRYGQFKLLNLTKRVTDVLQITKLYTFFGVYDDEARGIPELFRRRLVREFPNQNGCATGIEF